jgi:UDP-N-acetyl-D-mannosaminuronate dehydrogenase
MDGKIVVVGLGEVGKPLYQVIGDHTEVVGVDIEPVDLQSECEVMHICFPFQINNFVGQCVDYIRKYNPKLTIINSTVSPGTTRNVFNLAHSPIAYSPVRGKHIKMKQELLHYVKFVGGIDERSEEHTSELQSL